MRYTLILTIAILGFTACKKDKYTTAPQLKFKSISPTVVAPGLGAEPVLTFTITDAEGDIGITAKDTAYIYMKSLLTNDFDSLPFPNLQAASKSNFKADVDFSTRKVFKCKPIPGGAQHTDTLFFEVYVKDFAKNKSNIIKTGYPVYYTCR